ncbi:OmpA family protein [Sulfuriferula sp.]|uniref:OmpA family protein n=1 Tax=Sulfuriferula sp. TaxID=2025307 RepID=UPI00273152D8|nr:OmpA family protein [Sulfuriferula sp.]MDP2027880.1 OmpA family protein [Sulfuriferula sp.]
MRMTRIGLILASSAFFTACAYMPANDTTSRRLSPDYTAVGAPENMRAYVYGNRTVLEFEKDPMFLSVSDKNGAAIEVERVGRCYRLNQQLDQFTVSVNGRQTVVSASPEARVFSASTVVFGAPVREAPRPVVLEPAARIGDNAELLALLTLAREQLADVRQLLVAASKNPKASGAELFAANAKLKVLEEHLKTASAAMVQVTFPPYKTAFKPAPAVAKVLIESAESADSILVRGHTDSYKAGRLDAKIALDRANGAKAFLLKNGVAAEKITVSAVADGAFLVPNISKAAKAVNRRVEIEFVTGRIVEARSQLVKLSAK